MTRPSDSGASGVDWSGELEAVHEDGRVVPVTYCDGPDGDGDMRTNEDLTDQGMSTDYWTREGLPAPSVNAEPMRWRIRNTQPQPADTVTVGRMSPEEADAWIANGPDGPTLTALGVLSRLGLIKDDPVDPDVLIVRAILHAHQRATTPPDSGWGNMSYLKGSYDDTDTFKAALAAYRATAEKVLAWGEGE